LENVLAFLIDLQKLLPGNRRHKNAEISFNSNVTKTL
jgi:hypothetical protein